MDKDLINILRLIRSENVGPRVFYNLVKFCGSVDAALRMAPEMSLRGGKSKPINIYSEKQAIEEKEGVEKFGAKLISYQDKFYPSLLQNIPDKPPILTVLGNPEILKANILAIVGARNSSANSCKFTENIAHDLGKTGLIIASGLAKGIDSFAHKGSLETGTIAVVAGGIDKIYPPENERLFYEISKKGCIIAELPIGSIPRAQNFPQRNRIISGISLGRLVIEAALSSGSLITARLAAEQGREVFAVPGSPVGPRSSGNNKLLKEGAKLVTCIDDILEEIKIFNLHLKEKVENNEFRKPILDIQEEQLKKYHQELLQHLDYYPIDINSLVEITQIPFEVILLLITEMELAGRIGRAPGNKIHLIY
jgi:DNA processing protein